MLNICVFEGYLGGDPKLTFLPSGLPKCTFSMAVGQRWTDKDTGEIKESTAWPKIVCFGKQAEIANEFLKKGSHVAVQAKYVPRKFVNDKKEDVYTHHFDCEFGGLRFLDKKEQMPEQQPASEGHPAE